MLCLHYLYSTGQLGEMKQWAANYIAERRAIVSVVPVVETPEDTDSVQEMLSPSPSPFVSAIPSKAESAVVTTIAGGLKIKMKQNTICLSPNCCAPVHRLSSRPENRRYSLFILIPARLILPQVWINTKIQTRTAPKINATVLSAWVMN